MKNEPKITDTMAQAAAVTGLSVSVLKLAKKMGCKAFRTGSRVHLAELKAWLDDHKEEIQQVPVVTKEQADIRLKIQKYEIEKFNFAVLKGKFMQKGDVMRAVDLLAKERRASLQRRFEVELPPHLVGLDSIGITEKMKAAVDDVCREWSNRAEHYGIRSQE